MSEIQHELKIHASRTRVLQALTDRASIERWHGAKAAGNGDEWRLEYPDATVFRWKVVGSTPEQITWRCVEGPGQAVGKEASFRVSKAGGADSLVEFAYSGWPQASGNFRKCNTRWALLLNRLREEAEARVEAAN